MPSKNWYYHLDCYKTWVDGKKGYKDITSTSSQETYLENIKYYLYKELKMSVDFAKLSSQLKNFLKQGYTLKGILFTLVYFYDIKKGDIDRAHGGIGIVPFIYEEAKQYWIEQSSLRHNILDQIEKQMQERRERETIIVKRNNRKKKIISHLDEIGELEDE